MQLTKVIAILSLAATNLAAPTVEVIKRSNDGTSCNQSQGTLSCCDQKPVTQPVSSFGTSFGPTLGSILGVIPAILPLILPAVQVAAQCIPIIPIIDEGESCANSNVCCLTPSTGNAGSPGLISLLNNNQIAICPGLTF